MIFHSQIENVGVTKSKDTQEMQSDAQVFHFIYG